MSDEWGPWIEHDGSGCPCPGLYVATVAPTGREMEHIAHGIACDGFGRRYPVEKATADAWVWREPEFDSVIRYRIRKPKGLTVLEGLLEDVPEKEPAQ